MQNSYVIQQAGYLRLGAAAIVTLAVLLMLAALQRNLIYFPSRANADDLRRQAASQGLQVWHDAQGDPIGWRSDGRGDAGNRLLVFHGNAGYALDRTYFIDGFEAVADDWEVLLFEYPGYGARQGKPSQAYFETAAASALETLLQENDRPLFILGESLGSGIASAMAAMFPEKIAGLLLVTPFTSLVEVASHHYPFLPVRALLSDRYDSREALSHYEGPVAFLLAGRDEIVTTELGRQLHDAYRGPKWLQVESRAGHNTLPYHPTADWWQEASRFLIAGNKRPARSVDPGD